MINLIAGCTDNKFVQIIGILCAFFGTFLALKYLSSMLPKDAGREFAHDGKKSAGKPRGAGLIFILAFGIVAVLFGKLNWEILIYLVLTIASMLTGYLDDASKNPWGEFKKGALDLLIACLVAGTYLAFNGSEIFINILGESIVLNPIVFFILAVILVWVSINVTNCTDGVDGLSGTLSVITLFTIYLLESVKGTNSAINYITLILIACVLAYLWFNATPSKLMMGDAGSRALGIFISIAILKTGSPLLYIPVALMLIIDGGLGLLKISFRRFLKIEILNNVRTPIHDHVRKKNEWSNTQVVFRFAIIQIIVSFCVIYLIK